jgi:hypothetical protein
MFIRLPILGSSVLFFLWLVAESADRRGVQWPLFLCRSEHCSLAALSEIVVDCAITSGLGTIGEPIIEIG